MLDRATAADAEMRAERLDPLRACGLDAKEMTPVRMAGDGFDLDGLTGQRIGHEHRPRRRFRHAIAAVGETFDGEPLGQWSEASGQPAGLDLGGVAAERLEHLLDDALGVEACLGIHRVRRILIDE